MRDDGIRWRQSHGEARDLREAFLQLATCGRVIAWLAVVVACLVVGWGAGWW